MRKCSFCEKDAIANLLYIKPEDTKNLYFCDLHIRKYSSHEYQFNVSLEPNRYLNDEDIECFFNTEKEKISLLDIFQKLKEKENIKIEKLKLEIEKAVKEEDFEKAKKIKDQLDKKNNENSFSKKNDMD